MKLDENIISAIRTIIGLSLVLTLFAAIAVGYLIIDPSLSALKSPVETVPAPSDSSTPVLENGVHLTTGLAEGEGMQLVIANCLTCHSAKLIVQNRMDRNGWLSTIRWMQKTQNLRDLGENEDAILDYLAKHYAPEATGRRKGLEEITWYELAE